ncbi:uncharacterized protein BX663DRAFT_517689 [Cokeromyces recurvatus]|uniref:uncharacterized protein n=1 Tax=Cokeromyces recurvatus TaxID=90255 RepID=UPI00221EACED|nr:uncharacterized protein BX663DRAFT_517689 [Cokeromyces recurvatus]KAI7900457.1 hypothetical protein BX663DRAFT_517689 [Cokeromyces recurvatus]
MSNNTFKHIPHPVKVQNNLTLQFKEIDRMYANSDLRVFGRDTERIFKEINIIRKEQIELANEHVRLDSFNQSPSPILQTSENIEDEYKCNLVYFHNKKRALKSLMNKLDSLGQIMNNFKESYNFNPHADIDNNLYGEATTAPSSPIFSTFDDKKK